MSVRITELSTASDPTSDRFQVLAGSGEPGSDMLLAKIQVRKGSEPPLRRHRHEDLLMYVLDGCLTFEIEGQRQPASRGSWVVVPKGSAHGFIVDSVTARILMIVTPAGAEEHLAQLFGPGVGPDGGPSNGSSATFDRLVTTAARYGVDITGPAPTPT